MRNRGNSDCGIVAVAVAAVVPYRTVKARFGKLNRGGMESHEFRWILSEFSEFIRVRKRRETLTDFANRCGEGRYVVTVAPLGGVLGRLHYVPVVNGIPSNAEGCLEWDVLEVFRIFPKYQSMERKP